MVNANGSKNELEEEQIRWFVHRISFWTLVSLALGITTAFLYSVSGYSPSSLLGAFAILVTLLAAAFLAGTFFGLLFAFPNYERGNKVIDQHGEYFPNTKLSELADWLTKTIVGLALTQLAFIPHHIKIAARWFAEGIVGSAKSEYIGAATVISGVVGVFGLVLGFLSGFLLFRILLPRILRQTDGPGMRALGQIDQGESSRGKEETPRSGLPPSERKTFSVAAKVPFESLTNTDDMLRWAKAKIGIEEYPAACMAYERVLKIEPNNVGAIIQYVDVLGEFLDEHERAIELIENALTKSLTITKAQVLRLKRDRIFNLLWGNLDDAIRHAEEYIKDNGNNSRVLTHLIYACAGKYGEVVQDAEKNEMQAKITNTLQAIPPSSPWRSVMRQDVNTDELLEKLKDQKWFLNILGK